MDTIALTSGASLAILPVAIEHADGLAALVCENAGHLGEYLPAVAELGSPDAARSHLQAAIARAAAGASFEWHLFLNDQLCGAIRLKNIDSDNRKAEIGYFLGSAFGGQGIATLAVRAVLGYSFASLDLNRLELRCAAANTPSIRVAERLGFTLEGVLRQDEWLDGGFVDVHVFGLLRAEFAA
ncbi:GNAT family N-acetyltransferase [Massilia sp. Dwa41.01b]|uniref:GNAT family N-acetyltransferase n=1 Tax=unclassified Massilia TaxID=2609279 RepID=UPI001600E360|nr:MULTISPECIES: GNAT family protein [unclassified Massilia]QNA89481.1 GNAT family N-acetyltransferase [Massilia sp. Dwa41.01b]QNB00386.1 GNAT family N-acetyltransferase [Massilia sp. Se16.2.3]